MVSPADEGALLISCGPPVHRDRHRPEHDAEYLLGRDAAAAQAPHQAKDA